ncbi:hypothetical protein KY332_00190 [Candidatus Woesearchaeota archaeon]|nr:hypothetical protein [Candidatus Woesearchaeota archaeon]
MEKTLVIRTEDTGSEGGYRGLGVNLVATLDGVNYYTNGSSNFGEESAFLDFERKNKVEDGINYIIGNYDYGEVFSYWFVRDIEIIGKGKLKSRHPVFCKDQDRNLRVIVEESARKAISSLKE